MNCSVKNWFVGHDTDEWRDYDEDNVPFERIEKVYVPEEYSLEQIMNIFSSMASFTVPFSPFF